MTLLEVLRHRASSGDRDQVAHRLDGKLVRLVERTRSGSDLGGRVTADRVEGSLTSAFRVSGPATQVAAPPARCLENVASIASPESAASAPTPHHSWTDVRALLSPDANPRELYSAKKAGRQPGCMDGGTRRSTG